MPSWGQRFSNAKSVKIVEESICDPVERTLTTYTRNIAFTKIMVSVTLSDHHKPVCCMYSISIDIYLSNLNLPQSVTEKVVYKSLPESPNQTIAIRSAWIDSQVFGFSRAIRAFGCERFKKNCTKMVCFECYERGVDCYPMPICNLLLFSSNLQVTGFNHVLSSMFPTHAITTMAMAHGDHSYIAKATKLKEAAKKTSEQMKAQAEQIYQTYSAKN